MQSIVQNINSILFQQEKNSVIILDVHAITTETRALMDTGTAGEQDTAHWKPTNRAATAPKCDFGCRKFASIFFIGIVWFDVRILNVWYNVWYF